MNEIERPKEISVELPKETTKEPALSQPIQEDINATQPSPPGRNKTLKIILGIATFCPIFYIGASVLLFVTSGLVMAVTWGFGWGAVALNFLTVMSGYLMLLYPTIILIPILLFIYIIHVFKNKKISKNKKTLWVLVFLQGIFCVMLLLALATIRSDTVLNFVIYLGVFIITPFIALPIYWHNYIWKEPKQNLSSGNTSRRVYVLIGLYILFFLAAPVLMFGPDLFNQRFKILEQAKHAKIKFKLDSTQYAPPETLTTPIPLPTQTPNFFTRSYTKGITNGSFINNLDGWAVDTDGNADAFVDNGRLKLSVYKCAKSGAEQTFQINSDKLSFEWQTKADGWAEASDWDLLIAGSTAAGGEFPTPHLSGSSGKKEIDTSKFIGETATLQFRITPSSHKQIPSMSDCGVGDHANTYLWIDNVK